MQISPTIIETLARDQDRRFVAEAARHRRIAAARTLGMAAPVTPNAPARVRHALGRGIIALGTWIDAPQRLG
jgi:hypothetical protein